MKALQIRALTFSIQSFVTLFVIMDPPGATPIFLALVADKTPKERRVLAIKAAAVSFSVITLFALFGRMVKAKPVVRVESKGSSAPRRDAAPRKAAQPKEKIERTRTRTKKFK